ncbi:MAG: alpha/beta hydrolase-fold protein [Thermoguttaceae bacterium]|jgi:predicted peptidase
MKLVFVLLFTLLFAAATVRGDEPDPRSRLKKRQFKNSKGETLLYRLFVPPDYDAKKQYPVVLFLHGLGERGSDNELQLKHADVLRLISADVTAKHACLLVAPQCPDNDLWAAIQLDRSKPYVLSAEPTRAMRLTMELLDSLGQEFSIDRARWYITGLSMGGFGTLDLCAREPRKIAAAVPVCGGGDTSKAAAMAKIAFWVFHGGADDVVPPAFSHDMVAALKKAGTKVKYTEYPGVGHHSWTKAYEEPGLPEWLFSQHQ